jgi:hypothetical protein
LKLLLDDTTPQSKFYNHDSVSDSKGEEIQDVMSEDLQTLSDNEESAEDRDFKREQEKKRPSLVRLREVVSKERYYYE